MPVPRYERELDEIASPRFTRWYVRAFAVAAAVGLLIGIGWVIAGILYFRFTR